MNDFDTTYGYDLEALLLVPAPEGPADFAGFWRRTFEENARVPLNLARREVASFDPTVSVYEVAFDSLDGARIGGWLTVPADGRFVRGVVVSHGYGGRGGPDASLLGQPAVAIFPCARGFGLSTNPSIPDVAARHVLHGIESRETYVHRGCAADLWSAASALLELYPAARENLHYYGGSFGGGIGALTLPWDGRFQRAFLNVPSFGNHPLRVTLPCYGSGESVRHYQARHPEVLRDVLPYFDAATAARHIGVPVFVAAARADGSVPPPGQFAVYNALPGPKELFVRATGHPDTPEDDAALWQRLDEWFKV